MIKMKELIKRQTDTIRKASGMKMINEATYVAGKLPTLFKFAKQYLFDEGDIGNMTFWSKWTRQSFIHNVTASPSVEDTDSKVKFAKEIDKAFDTMKKDVERAYKKWENSVKKATKPFNKEYTGV